VERAIGAHAAKYLILSVGSRVYSPRGSGSASVDRKAQCQATAPHMVMAQLLDPLPPNSTDNMLCCYVNATSHIQVARITNVPNWYFERVVFPGQRLVFETLASAQLEIHTGMMASSILSDTIPCDRLCVDEASSDVASFNPTNEQHLEVQNDGISDGISTDGTFAAVLTSVD